MIFLSGERKNNSLPSRRHRGCCPPPVETWYWVPGPENGATYTSQRPDSLDEYATQRPSGENCPSRSAALPDKRRYGFPPPFIGKTQRCRALACCKSVYNKNWPSCDQSLGADANERLTPKGTAADSA